MERRVLCVGIGEQLNEMTTAVEERDDLVVVEANEVDTAEALLKKEPVAAVVTAHELPDGSGMDVIDAVETTGTSPPCVLFTNASPADINTERAETVTVEYLRRETDASRLGFVVEDMISHDVQAGFMTPQDEGERLDALESYNIESLPVKDSFDRLTDLIADRFDAELAFIGLVDRDVERFVSCAGGDLDPVPREETMCTHAILQQDVMVVEDVRADKRFSENELLAELGVRFYAGANLTDPDGHTIGSVCVIDMEPREFSSEERAHYRSTQIR
ncbi:MAG: GAF domain-containing protein [Halobaculum sp.]